MEQLSLIPDTIRTTWHQKEKQLLIKREASTFSLIESNSSQQLLRSLESGEKTGSKEIRLLGENKRHNSQQAMLGEGRSRDRQEDANTGVSRTPLPPFLCSSSLMSHHFSMTCKTNIMGGILAKAEPQICRNAGECWPWEGNNGNWSLTIILLEFCFVLFSFLVFIYIYCDHLFLLYRGDANVLREEFNEILGLSFIMGKLENGD